MQAIFGVIFHFIGGFASGSFYIPYKRVKGWAWETYWIVGGIFSWLFIPLLAAWLTVPDFMGIIRSTDMATLSWTYILGLLWGVGGLTFGLGLRYLGISLGQSVALGFTSAFGALIPPIYRDLFSDGTGGGNLFWYAGICWRTICTTGCPGLSAGHPDLWSCGLVERERPGWKKSRKQLLNLM